MWSSKFDGRYDSKLHTVCSVFGISYEKVRETYILKLNNLRGCFIEIGASMRAQQWGKKEQR